MHVIHKHQFYFTFMW